MAAGLKVAMDSQWATSPVMGSMKDEVASGCKMGCALTGRSKGPNIHGFSLVWATRVVAMHSEIRKKNVLCPILNFLKGVRAEILVVLVHIPSPNFWHFNAIDFFQSTQKDVFPIIFAFVMVELVNLHGIS